MTQTYCVHKETLISVLDAVMHNTQYRHQKKFASLQGLYWFRRVLSPVSGEKGGSSHVQGMNFLSDVLFISLFLLSNS